MEIATKEIRGLNIRLLIGWGGAVITFIVLGTMWYAGINNSIRENKDTMEKIEKSIESTTIKNDLEVKAVNQRLESQQLQLDQMKWEFDNFKQMDENKIP